MALINPVDGLACVPQWQQALGQFFSLVQVFNPMLADIAQQMQLLESFALLKTDWKESLSRARGILDRQLQYRRRRSSEMLVAFIEDALCHRCRKNLAADTNRSETVRILKDRYADALRSKERQNRVQIEQLYQHRRLQSDPAILALESSDLMDRQSWSIWGLERKKVAALAAGSGALAGAVIDAGVGGSSLMLGALSGAAIGGVATWFWGKELARVRIHGYFSLARQYVEVGPVRNPVFAWALFGRAVLHLHAIRQRSHARRDKLALDTDTASALDRFDSKEKAIISRWLLAGSAGKMQRRREEITALIQERV